MIERQAIEIDELTVLIRGRLPVAVVELDLHGLAFHRKLAFHRSFSFVVFKVTVCAGG
jgi:hypothetical protein